MGFQIDFWNSKRTNIMSTTMNRVKFLKCPTKGKKKIAFNCHMNERNTFKFGGGGKCVESIVKIDKFFDKMLKQIKNK